MSGTVTSRACSSDGDAVLPLAGGANFGPRAGDTNVGHSCEPDSPTVEKAGDDGPRADLRTDWLSGSLDTNPAERMARYVGIPRGAGTVVIEDDALLDPDWECSLEALRPPLDVARRQSAAVSAFG